MSILYISYDGMMEPLGQSQVLSYLERAESRPVHLISFEKPADWADAGHRKHVAERIAASGIVWHPQRYHRRPSALATAYDIAVGIAVGTRLVRKYGLRIVHARSYVPATMALAIKRLTGAKFLFDMRGFWADERVDGAIWPRGGTLYRAAKFMERRFLLRADAVVSLTHAAQREIESFDYLSGRVPPITIIPTCADLDRFTPDAAGRRGPFVLGYVGNVAHWYMFDEVLRCYKALLDIEPGARLLVVNRGQHDDIREQVRAAALPAGSVELAAAEHSQMPGLVRRMSAAVMMARPAYSHLARAPTKLAEFLGCGVPCLSNWGIGDVTDILEGQQVGIVLKELDDAHRIEAMRSLVRLSREPAVIERCVATARSNFSLESGVAAYRRLYARLSVQR